VPAIIVSPWVGESVVINDEYRHTSLLRKVWDLGEPFTERDADAATFEHVLSRETPREPASWPDVHPLPVPDWQLTKVQLGEALSTLGKAIGPGLIEHAKQAGLPIPADLADSNEPPTGEQLVEFVFGIAAHYFPRLADAAETSGASY
jgi:phospholipase C